MTLEHAPPNRRAFFTSFTLSGTQAGLILATLVFIPIAKLPEADLLSWAWRIPFFLSLAVVVVGFWVRRSLPETPVFIEEAKKHETAKLPLFTLFRNNWADVLRIIFAALISVVSTIFSVFTLSYAVNTMHIDRSTMLTVLVLANIVALGAIPLWASLADRIGRRPVFIFGALGCAVLIWPYIWAISQAKLSLAFMLGILLSGIVYSASNGVWPALYGEMFDTRVRLSGMAIGTQIGFALGGFAPTISAALLGTGPNGWIPVAAFTSVTAIVAAISAATALETYRTPMQDLGKKLMGVTA
jgi:MFS family permease